MQIHVIKSNESLTTIARTYHTTVKDITEANELPNPNNLVVGQSIVIPIIGHFYFVQPGDSLYSIAKRVGVPYQELASINRINVNQPLNVGLRLYIPEAKKRNAEFNAYVEPRGTTVAPVLENSAREAAPYLNLFSPFQLPGPP